MINKSELGVEKTPSMDRHTQFAINVVAQLTGFIVNVGISFLLTPYIVKHIGSEAYGFVGLANNFVSYAQVITVALNSMAGRFITIKIHQNDIEQSNRYFTSVVYANVITAAVLTLPSVLVVLNLQKLVNISPEILSDVQLLWAFIFLNFLISVVSATYTVATFVRNKLYLSSIQNIISNFVRVLVLVVAFSFFVPSVWYVGLAVTVASLYLFVWNVHYTRKLLPEITVDKKYFDVKVIRVLLSSGIWNSFTRLSAILSTGLDLVITNLYVGGGAMGLLSVAKTVPTAILSLFGTLASVFTPELTISYAKDDFEEMRNQLLTSIKFLGMFSAIPVAALFAYGDSFYQLWVPGENASLLHILTIISCVEYMFSLPLEGLWNLFTATNKVKQTSIYMFVNSIVTIGIVLVGVRLVDDPSLKLYIIAGTSTFFAVIRSLLFLPIYGAHCLGMKWSTFYPAILKNSISVVVISGFALLLKAALQPASWLLLIVVVAVTGMFALALNFFIILNKGERNLLMNKLLRRAA